MFIINSFGPPTRKIVLQRFRLTNAFKFIPLDIFNQFIQPGEIAAQQPELSSSSQPSSLLSMDAESPQGNSHNGKTTLGLKRKIVNFYVWGSVMVATGIPITILGVSALRNETEEEKLEKNEPSDGGLELITAFGIGATAGGLAFLTIATILAAKYRKRTKSIET